MAIPRRRRKVDRPFKVRPVEGDTLGDRVIAWIQQMPVHRGKLANDRRRVKLFDYQKEIIRGIHNEGITHSVVSMPRKLGKSQIAVWCVLARMLMPELQEPSSQIVAVSVTQKQAQLIFDSVADIIDMLDPKTINRTNIIGSNGPTPMVIVPSKSIRFRTVCGDKSGAKLMGFDINFAVIDEPGSMDSMSYQSLKTGSPNGELLLIGTQSHLAEAEEHWYTKILQDQDLPSHHYRYFLSASREETDKHWGEEWLWRKVTPALEIKPLKYIRSEYSDAVKFGSEKSFKTAHLNSLIPSLSAELSIYTQEEMEACWQPDSSIEDGSQIIIGVDLSQVSDLCVVCCYDPKSYATESFFWIPQRAVEDAPNVPYDKWQEKGYLTIVAGKCISFEDVVDKILSWQKQYQVIAVCRDNWLSNQFQLTADNRGVTAPSVAIKQTREPMNVATKQLQSCIKQGKIKINNPCLRWNMQCTRYSQDTHNNIRPHKQLSMAGAKGHRVDGMFALCNIMWYVSEHEIVSNLKGYFVGEL